MSSISLETLKKLAQLSALSVSDDEAVTLQKDLTEILGYVEQLSSVNTEDVEPTYYVHGLNTVTRPDEIQDSGVTQDELLKNAPEKKDGSIVVPRVLE